MNTTTNTPFVATDPSGTVWDFSSLGEAKRDFGLNLSAVHRCLKGKLHTHKGWSCFRYLHPDKIVRYRSVDQLKNVIATLKHNPNSRRIVMNLWHSPAMNGLAKLPCCHGSIIQFYVSEGKLSCHMYQRSCDVFIGFPVNIAGYALLTHLVANATGLEVGELTISLGDVHIYQDHMKQVEEQLSREPFKNLPQLKFSIKRENIDDVVFEDFEIVDYECHPSIKAKVSA